MIKPKSKNELEKLREQADALKNSESDLFLNELNEFLGTTVDNLSKAIFLFDKLPKFKGYSLIIQYFKNYNELRKKNTHEFSLDESIEFLDLHKRLLKWLKEQIKGY